MGKKKNKAKLNNKQHSDEELLRSAERAASRAQWKDALAAYKELNKRHPAQYHEAILKLQMQRYQDFIDRDMYESAEQLMAVMQGQLSVEQLQAFELQRAVALQDQDAIAALSWQQLEAQSQTGQAFDADLLESLIFSDNQPSTEFAQQPEAQTLLAVRRGLQALCKGDVEALAKAMAAINRRSQLAHWKLLLRALEAWYSGDDAGLDACLAKLQDLPSVAAQISQGLALMRQADAAEMRKSPAVLAHALALHDIADSTVVADLLQVDHYLENRQWLDAVKFAESAFNFGKLDQTAIEQSVLDRLVARFKIGNSSPYQHHIFSLISHTGARRTTTWHFRQAQFAAWELPCECIKCIEKSGQGYLKASASRGEPENVQARAHLHLAETFLKEVEEDYFEPQEEKHFLEKSVQLLQAALQLDSEYIDAGLKLLDTYRLVGDSSAANKLLDQLAASHRDNPKILQQAGKQCIARGTLVRGLKQLEQALSLDPHLPNIKLDFLQACLRKAQSDFQKGQTGKARASFAQMQPHLQEGTQHRDSCDCCDYWFDARLMRLRQLQLEYAYGGDSAEIEALQRTAKQDWEGRELMREALQYLLIEQFGTPQSIAGSHDTQVAFFREVEPLLEMPPAQVESLLKILNEASRLSKSKIEWGASFTRFLDAYRIHYCPERLEGILPIFWAAVPRCIEPSELIESCKLWSKADRHHPQLKMLLLWARYSMHKTIDQNDLDELEHALETARRRKDAVALEKGDLLHQTFRLSQRYSSLLDRHQAAKGDFEADDVEHSEAVENVEIFGSGPVQPELDFDFSSTPTGSADESPASS